MTSSREFNKYNKQTLSYWCVILIKIWNILLKCKIINLSKIISRQNYFCNAQNYLLKCKIKNPSKIIKISTKLFLQCLELRRIIFATRRYIVPASATYRPFLVNIYRRIYVIIFKKYRFHYEKNNSHRSNRFITRSDVTEARSSILSRCYVSRKDGSSDKRRSVLHRASWDD